MDNIIYERDYKEEKARRNLQANTSISSHIFDYVVASGALRPAEDAYSIMPRVINEPHKAAYERILSALDRMANVFGGQIKGVVDYKNWEASIYVILPFVEFSTEEELELMKDIATNSQTVTFTVAPDGKIRMKVLIDYFQIVGEIDNMLEEEIMNCPELVALLEEADRQEKQQLIENPQVAMLVKIGAESLGVSEADYLDRLVTFLRNPPDDFMADIQHWLDEHSEK